jgi:hypothetical protein
LTKVEVEFLLKNSLKLKLKICLKIDQMQTENLKNGFNNEIDSEFDFKNHEKLYLDYSFSWINYKENCSSFQWNDLH